MLMPALPIVLLAVSLLLLPSLGPETLTADQTAVGEAGSDSPEPAESTAMPDIHGQDWQPLFNGTDLTGWTQKNGTATYRVEDGAIVGKTAEGSPNSFLCTDQQYDDFELTFEVKVDPELNSGVQIRSLSKADFKHGRVHGPQVEIETAPGESGYLYSEGTGRGWITTEQPIKDAYDNQGWNRFVVRAVGDRIETWVNGRQITAISDPDSSPAGFVGLQVHGIEKGTGPFEVRWRDIRIRELKPPQ